MDLDFWFKKWEDNNIGFHESEVNSLLTGNLETINPPKNSKILVPLCGKTLDIGWLITQGYHVIGIELVERAVIQLFEELELKPEVSRIENISIYSAENVDIFVGDIFDVSIRDIGNIDLVYDRAALVALPEEVRIKYAAHIINITNCAPQLLISYEYDQSAMKGPPYSIYEKDIEKYYENNYTITCLENVAIRSSLKGERNVRECVWLLGHKHFQDPKS